MKEMRWSWNGFLILFLIVGAIGYSEVGAAVRSEPNVNQNSSQFLQMAEVVPPITTQTPTTQVPGSTSISVTPAQPLPSVTPQIPVTPPPPVPIPTPLTNAVTPQPRIPQPRAPQPRSPQVVAPQPPQPAAPPARSPVAPKGSGFVFNFDNADLYEVIRVIAEILKINYIIDPRVKGVVNIHTAGQVSGEDIFPIFQAILKLNGATAVKRDNVYEIVPFGDAKKLYTPPSTPDESKALSPEEKYIIQIVSLQYVPVGEVSKLIKPFLSDGADIVEHPPSNILIVGDTASNVKKSLDMIALFDIDIFTDLRVRIYPILNADVTEVAKEMEKIFTSFEVSLKSARGVGITFTPITRINSLLVVSSIANIFEKVEGWIKELDKIPTEGTKFSVFVYYVQNSKAKDLAEVLKQIFVTKKEKKDEFKQKTVTPEQPPGQRSVRPTPTPAAPATQEEAGAVPEGEINIVVDETNNALVIRAFARDYRSILETVKKLDIYPKQVLIEMLLAEVTLTGNIQFGVEFAKLLDTVSHGRYLQTIDILEQTTIPGAGIRYSIVEEAGRFSAAIKAAADDNRLKVISSPNILASNNKEAKIQVGFSQPILTNTYTTGVTAGTTTGVVEGTIEYKDIGVILTVTPRISDGGLVTMELTIEDSTVSSTALGSLTNVPRFGKRTAKTVLSVLERQTIVIGGLIKNSKNFVRTGIPLLYKIPILGGLFGTQQYKDENTELIIMLTPHVITDQIQSNAVTQEFRDKIEGIKKELEKKEKKEKKDKKEKE